MRFRNLSATSSIRLLIVFGNKRYELSNKIDWDNSEGYERIELAVVASDDFATEFLCKRNAVAVGEGYSTTRFQLADTLPKVPVHVFALDHAIFKQCQNPLTCGRHIGSSDRLVIDFAKVGCVGVADSGRARE